MKVKTFGTSLVSLCNLLARFQKKKTLHLIFPFFRKKGFVFGDICTSDVRENGGWMTDNLFCKSMPNSLIDHFYPAKNLLCPDRKAFSKMAPPPFIGHDGLLNGLKRIEMLQMTYSGFHSDQILTLMGDFGLRV